MAFSSISGFLPGSLIIEEFETDDTDPDMEQFVFTNTSGIRVLIVIVERPLSTGMFGEQTLESHLINSGDSFSGVFDSSRVGVYVYHASTSSGGALAGFARFDR